MKLLVVEGNELVTKIYRRLFKEKNYDVDFVENESECFERSNQYDYIIFKNPQSATERKNIDNKVKELELEQKILFLPPLLDSENEKNELMRETKEIIENPLGILALFAKIELTH